MRKIPVKDRKLVNNVGFTYGYETDVYSNPEAPYFYLRLFYQNLYKRDSLGILMIQTKGNDVVSPLLFEDFYTGSIEKYNGSIVEVVKKICAKRCTDHLDYNPPEDEDYNKFLCFMSEKMGK